LLISSALYADSEIPQGTPRSRAYSIWHFNAVAQAFSSREFRKLRVNSSGIRYSNIVPLQESKTCPFEVVYARPNASQWCTGTSPLAMATRLARRDSLASKS